MIEYKYVLLILTRPARLGAISFLKIVCHTQLPRGRRHHAILGITRVGLECRKRRRNKTHTVDVDITVSETCLYFSITPHCVE